MKKKIEPITFWENNWTWDWNWFAFGGACAFKDKFYMIHLGFLHFMRCRIKMYPVEQKKNKKK